MLAEVPLDGLLIQLEAVSLVASQAQPRERLVQTSSSTSSKSTRRTRTRSITGTGDLERLPVILLAAVTLIQVTTVVGERMIATWHTVIAPTTRALLNIEILAIMVAATGTETKVMAARTTEVREEAMGSKVNQTMEDLAIIRYDSAQGGEVEMTNDCHAPNMRLARCAPAYSTKIYHALYHLLPKRKDRKSVV